MYRIFDFVCVNKDCDEYNIEFEELVKEDEEVICDLCNHKKERLIPNPRGRVEGSETPVKQ